MSLDLATIFSAGLLTFLSPCVLPLVPVYLASLAGGDVRGLAGLARAQLFLRALLFSLGFVAVFALMGAGASGLGRVLSTHKLAFQTVGGILILLFGFKFLGLIQIPWLDRVLRMDDRRLNTRMGSFGAILMGVVFGAAWTPCVGPVLGSVLTFTASSTTSPATGAFTLAVYGAGMALPLLLIAPFSEAGLRALKKMRRGLPVVERVLGVLLLVVAGSMLFSWNPSSTSTGSSEAPQSRDQGPAMLELYSQTCPVCQAMQPVVEAVTGHCAGKGVRFEKVDVSAPENRRFVAQYRLVGVPTFVFIGADGTEQARLVGQQSREELLQALSVVAGESCPGVGRLPGREQEGSCHSTSMCATGAVGASS
jgi:cytochrome c-type biogenesis protein